MPREEPILRLTDKERLRAKILEGRGAGDPRWQQKWDDLDAFPYHDTVEHQLEWLRDHPVLVEFLDGAGKPAAKPAVKPPAKTTPDMDARILGDYLAGYGTRARKAVDASPWKPGGPAPTAPSAGFHTPPNRSGQDAGRGMRQPKYVPPPPMKAPEIGPRLREEGLDRWMPPKYANLFRR